MRTCLLALAAAGGLAAAAPAFVTILPKEAAKPQAAVAKSDAQDLILRAEDGLYKIRLHLSVNGKSPTANVDAFLEKAFDYFDRNGDKVLDAKEVAKLVPPFAFQFGGNFIFNGRQQAPRMQDLDTNKDGKIDRAEFANYYRRSGLAALQVSIQPPQAQAERTTTALYKHLAPGRNFLTQADLAAAWDRLQRLDSDEDEIITTMELLQRTYNPFYGGQDVEEIYYPGMMRAQGAPQAAAFISLTPGEPASVSAAKVLTFLQQAKQSFLLPAKLALNPKLPGFVSGPLRELDRAVLTAWLEQPPDLELNAPLGTIAEGIGRLVSRGNDGGVRLKPTGRNTPLEKATKLGADGHLHLATPGEMVEFTRSPSNNNFDQTQYYRQQFKTEAGDKMYMTREQMQQSPQIQFLVNLFDYADRDGDGKLYVKELNTFLDLIAEGSNSRVILSIIDQGRSLFALIDTNHDQRLGRRELLDATRKFSAFDRNGDGKLERSELPAQLRLTIGQGNNNGVVYAPQLGGMAVTTTGPGKGPAWFRKMDRNKDGDVSPREFLGTPEEFRRIDTDGDGLISAAEAEKYQKELEAQAKNQVQKK